MKIITSMINKMYSTSHTHEVNLPGYYASREVSSDLDRVIEYHQLRYEKWKQEYIKSWGQERFDEMIKKDEQ